MEDKLTISYENAARLVSSRLSEERYYHTLGVVGMAEELAGLNGLNYEKARLAALLHDLFKEIPLRYQLKLAKRWNLLKFPEDEGAPHILHGPLAAYWLEFYWLYPDREVLNAISRHTLGYPGMSKLDMVIYCADLVEPSRDFPGVDKLRKALYDNLEAGTLACLEHTVSFLEKTNRLIHPLTLQTLQDLQRRLQFGTK
ncbi:MAG: bis(5'-nucleosyl)-tetraphosphatase (symmetrical) YqeK [Desulfitobacterium hafniense]|nr:bis(5'-nucleosyl)-tetraphosphatase (symmetrical) YqeK [Desulfitobacterium hafniense]